MLSRTKLAILIVVSVCLVSGVARQAVVTLQDSGGLEAARDSEPVVAVPEAPLEPAFGAQEIIFALRDQNPTLTEREVSRIASAVLESSERYSLDPQLVTAVMIVESGARPWVRSPKGAVGLMQVMPHMAVRYDLAGDLTRIESNVEIGCLILSDNIRRWGEQDGISAYFWGSRIRGASYLKRVLVVRDRIGFSES